MAIQRLLAIINNKLSEYVPIDVSAGATSAGQVLVLNSAGTIDTTAMPSGITPPTFSILTSEALAAGNWTNTYSNAGVANVRKADGSTSGKESNGFVLAAFASGVNATVYTGGINTAVTTQTPGTVFLSSVTPGAGTTLGATGVGQTYQQVGIATSPTAVVFEPMMPILRA